MGHAGVDMVGKALVQYLAELGTAVLPWADTASTAWASAAAYSGIGTIAGHVVDENAAAWGVGEDAAVGTHGRRGCVGPGEEKAYTAARAVFGHCGGESQVAHEEWPAGECSSRRQVVAVMAFLRPAVDFKPTRPAQRAASKWAGRPDSESSHINQKDDVFWIQ